MLATVELNVAEVDNTVEPTVADCAIQVAEEVIVHNGRTDVVDWADEALGLLQLIKDHETVNAGETVNAATDKVV